MQSQPGLAPPDTQAPAPLLVACLCAQWCDTCRDYDAVFLTAQAQFQADAHFVRIDIEDDEELLDGLEVENFPTLLIARGAQPLFFGAILPHAQTLARLVEAALAGDLKPLPTDPPVDALAQRLRDVAGP